MCVERPELIGSPTVPEVKLDKKGKPVHDEEGKVVYEDVPFVVTVPRSVGGVRLIHNKPVHVSTLVPRSTGRIIEDDETTPLLYWLTGGPENRPAEETDIYGIVLVDSSPFESALQEIMMLTMSSMQTGDGKGKESALKKQMAVQTKVAAEMQAQLNVARAKADERVRRAMSITHNNLLKSWESLKSEGKGTYTPSITESLGYYIIKAEVDRKIEMQRKFHNDMTDGIPGSSRV